MISDYFFFFQAEDGIRDVAVTGVQTCALPILLRLLSRSVTGSSVGVARAMRGAAEIIGEYGHYYEIVGEDWDIEALPLPLTVKILAVADAFETLQMATPVRPAFPKWTALEEVEKGAGKTFAKDAVRALRSVAGRPEAAAPEAGLRGV